MYNVSNEYKSIMNRPIRNRAYMYVSLGIINQEAQNSAKFEGKFTYWSNLSTPLNNKAISGEYATMEQNFFKTDGSMLFVPENNEYAQFIQSSGISTENILGTILIRFDDIYDIKGLTLEFSKNYPTKFKIVSDEKEIEYSNNADKFVTEDNFGSTSSIKIIPESMIGGEQRLRINKLLIGVGITFSNNEIESSSISEYNSPISEELPYSQISLTLLDNENRFNVDDNNSFINFLETGQAVKTYIGLEHDDGEIEQIPMNIMYLENWKSTRGKMNFIAKDIFSFMDEVYEFGNTINERTLYQDAVDVLTDYGLQPDEYEIDECLKDIVVTNPLPRLEHAKCLQLIANAGRCILFQNRHGKVCIKANFANVLEPEDMVVETTSSSEWSNPINVLKGTDYVYADMTKNFFSADGSMYFMPEDGSYLQTSYVSSEVSNEIGLFNSNPNFSITLPAAYIYYSIYINFDGNPPKEMIIRTYHNGTLMDSVTFTELNKENYISYEFNTFDKMEFEFTKASANNRVLVNKVSFGNLSDYVLTKQNMLEEPIGYQEKKTKSVSVRIFTFKNNSSGKPEEINDSVYYKQSINTVGTSIIFENPLISTESHAKQVAEWLGNYFSNNISYDVNYRGDPILNATDIIYMESDVLNNLQVEIEQHDFTFNGAFGGSLQLRRALRMMG